MDSKGRQTTPDAPPATAAAAAAHGLETKFSATLSFSLANQGLQIKSKASTIMLEAILLDAVDHAERLKDAPLPEDGVVTVQVDYDMLTDRLELESNASRILAKGVIAHALGAVTRNQTAQNFATYKAAMEKRVAGLEARAGVPKIILPGG